MLVSIDFESDEAIYIQIRNQIVMGIANEELHEGDSLPSVRQMAEYTGINMHTVNKAYGILKDEGLVIKEVPEIKIVEEINENPIIEKNLEDKIV